MQVPDTQQELEKVRQGRLEGGFWGACSAFFYDDSDMELIVNELLKPACQHLVQIGISVASAPSLDPQRRARMIELLGELLRKHPSLRKATIFGPLSGPEVEIICSNAWKMVELAFESTKFQESSMRVVGKFIAESETLTDVTFTQASFMSFAGVQSMIDAALRSKSLTMLRTDYACNSPTGAMEIARALQSSEHSVTGSRCLNLDLRFNVFQDGVALILEGAARCNCFVGLNLIDSDVTRASIETPIDILKYNARLSGFPLTFLIYRNGLFRSPFGIDVLPESFLSAVQTDTILHVLSLANCNMSNEQVTQLAEALQFNKTLKVLRLSHNAFDGLGAKALGLMLKNNGGIKVLDLALTPIADAGALYLAMGLVSNNSLVCLNVLECNIANSGARKLGRMLRSNATLKQLLLSVYITEPTALTFAKALQHNSTLEHLRMTCCYGSAELTEKGNKYLLHNGALRFCDLPLFKDICERNKAIHARVKRSVQIFLLGRWHDKDCSLRIFPKDVIRIIAKDVWSSRTHVKVWTDIEEADEESQKKKAKI